MTTTPTAAAAAAKQTSHRNVLVPGKEAEETVQGEQSKQARESGTGIEEERFRTEESTLSTFLTRVPIFENT